MKDQKHNPAKDPKAAGKDPKAMKDQEKEKKGTPAPAKPATAGPTKR